MINKVSIKSRKYICKKYTTPCTITILSFLFSLNPKDKIKAVSTDHRSELFQIEENNILIFLNKKILIKIKIIYF